MYSVSRLVDINAGVDFLGLCDQKISYNHVSDFERLRIYGHFLIPVHAVVWTALTEQLSASEWNCGSVCNNVLLIRRRRGTFLSCLRRWRKFEVCKKYKPRIFFRSYTFFRRKKRNRVHEINVERKEFGEFHTLMRELRQDEKSFYIYFRMPSECFDEILSVIKENIRKMDKLSWSDISWGTTCNNTEVKKNSFFNLNSIIQLWASYYWLNFWHLYHLTIFLHIVLVIAITS